MDDIQNILEVFSRNGQNICDDILCDILCFELKCDATRQSQTIIKWLMQSLRITPEGDRAVAWSVLNNAGLSIIPRLTSTQSQFDPEEVYEAEELCLQIDYSNAQIKSLLSCEVLYELKNFPSVIYEPEDYKIYIPLSYCMQWVCEYYEIEILGT